MEKSLTIVTASVAKYHKNKALLLDIIRDVQAELRCVSDEAIALMQSHWGFQGGCGRRGDVLPLLF